MAMSRLSNTCSVRLSGVMPMGTIRPALEWLLALQVLEQALEQYVAQSVPQDHPMFPVVSQSLQMLISNPNWDYHKKCAYMQRLVNDLV